MSNRICTFRDVLDIMMIIGGFVIALGLSSIIVLAMIVGFIWLCGGIM